MSKGVVVVPFASLKEQAAAGEAGKTAEIPFEHVPERSPSQMPAQDLSLWTPAPALAALAGGIAALFRPGELRPIGLGKNRRD